MPSVILQFNVLFCVSTVGGRKLALLSREILSRRCPYHTYALKAASSNSDYKIMTLITKLSSIRLLISNKNKSSFVYNKLAGTFGSRCRRAKAGWRNLARKNCGNDYMTYIRRHIEKNP